MKSFYLRIYTVHPKIECIIMYTCFLKCKFDLWFCAVLLKSACGSLTGRHIHSLELHEKHDNGEGELAAFGSLLGPPVYHSRPAVDEQELRRDHGNHGARLCLAGETPWCLEQSQRCASRTEKVRKRWGDQFRHQGRQGEARQLRHIQVHPCDEHEVSGRYAGGG